MDDLGTELFNELLHARNLDRDIREAYAKWFPSGEETDSRKMFHAFVRELKRLHKESEEE
jgi:hypothetical protein